MDTKRRQYFQCENALGETLALGIFYDEENVQLTWRRSVGFTQEQYHSIAKMFGVEPGVTCVKLVPQPNPTTYAHDTLETIVIKETQE